MNTDSIDCRKRTFGAAHDTDGIERPGDFCFDPDLRHLYVYLPGSSGPTAIAIAHTTLTTPYRVWQWDGNQETPTLSPSIHLVGTWHGWLRAGKLVSC